jgi:hypothetical protein
MDTILVILALVGAAIALRALTTKRCKHPSWDVANGRALCDHCKADVTYLKLYDPE